MSESDVNRLSEAVRLLRAGGVVAFPTETVYGLGADATNAAAIAKVFAIKGRPATNPLIVHVANESVARRYAASWPDEARRLAAEFWPGALTLVLPKTDSIVAQVTAGRLTVGLRVPNHPLALELLAMFDGALAGPSANRSNHISPTTAEHVRKELGDRVDLILDGGPCAVGIESTVLDLSGRRPTILRPGAVSPAQIERVIGRVELFAGSVTANTPAIGPGLHEVHYSPSAPAYRFDVDQIAIVAQWRRDHGNERAVLIAHQPLAGVGAFSGPHQVIQLPSEPAAYAQGLYAALHAADEKRPAAIWVQMPPDEPRWMAVRDRLRRATKEIE